MACVCCDITRFFSINTGEAMTDLLLGGLFILGATLSAYIFESTARMPPRLSAGFGLIAGGGIVHSVKFVLENFV